MKTALALAVLLAAPAAALAHAELERAEPRVGSTVAMAPSVVTLTFSEEVDAKSSSAEARDLRGVRVDRGMTIDPTHPNRMILRLKPVPPGEYAVIWRARSGDGDTTQGRFVFTVAP